MFLWSNVFSSSIHPFYNFHDCTSMLLHVYLLCSQTSTVSRIQSKECNTLCHIYSSNLLYMRLSARHTRQQKRALPYTLLSVNTNTLQLHSDLHALQTEDKTTVVCWYCWPDSLSPSHRRPHIPYYFSCRGDSPRDQHSRLLEAPT